MDTEPSLDTPSEPPIVVMIGVSGSGKSEVGRALARRLGVGFQEGDDLHPASNIAKMRAGVPLDDADREPWLKAIASWIAATTAHRRGGVVSCSALRHVYRDRLRAAGDAGLRMVLLDPDEAVLRARLDQRRGHFMPPSLLTSQLATLELPSPAERILVLTRDEGVDALVAIAAAWLGVPRP